MFTFLKNLLKKDHESEITFPEPDYAAIVDQIKKRESTEEIAPGKKIHEVDYANFELRLDRDIANNYRVTVFLGSERNYSFTIFATKNEFEKLESAYRIIIDFLKGDQKITDLPDSELMKGFYFGNGNN